MVTFAQSPTALPGLLRRRVEQCRRPPRLLWTEATCQQDFNAASINSSLELQSWDLHHEICLMRESYSFTAAVAWNLHALTRPSPNLQELPYLSSILSSEWYASQDLGSYGQGYAVRRNGSTSSARLLCLSLAQLERVEILRTDVREPAEQQQACGFHASPR
ncbi:hypothetical protein MRB53_038357 [Persea americana]|nr:hypothetical protein MRB53_038357 [Persea americana]